MKALFAAAMAALFCATPASAVVRIFDFTARVDHASSSLAPVGAIVSGRFSYDDALQPTYYYDEGSDGSSALYQHPSITFIVTFSGQTFSGADHVSVQDVKVGADIDEGDDFYISRSSSNFFMQLGIFQRDRLWLDSARLPDAFPSPLWQGPFPEPDSDVELMAPYGEFTFINLANGHGLFAIVQSVTPANVGAVPEPATWAMMIVGFGLLGAAVRRRGQRVAVAA